MELAYSGASPSPYPHHFDAIVRASYSCLTSDIAFDCNNSR